MTSIASVERLLAVASTVSECQDVVGIRTVTAPWARDVPRVGDAQAPQVTLPQPATMLDRLRPSLV